MSETHISDMAEPDRNFRVISVVKEPLHVIARFVAWYLEQGAREIVLNFSDPDDPVADLMERVDKVTVIRCKPEYWKALGCRPDDRFTKRQNLAASASYRSIASGWVLFVDADELLWFREASIAESVAGFPAETECVRFLTSEMIFVGAEPDRLHFRTPMEPRQIRQVYKRAARFFRRRRGFVSHYIGKSMTRAQLPGVMLRQHWPQRGAIRLDGVVYGPQEGAHLLHLAGETFADWQAKLGWRISSRGLLMPIRQAVEAAQDDDQPDVALRGLYRSLFCFGPRKLHRLKAAGKYLSLNPDFQEMIARHLPQLAGDHGAAP